MLPSSPCRMVHAGCSVWLDKIERDDERTASASSSRIHICQSLNCKCNRAHGTNVVSCLQMFCTYT